jgi:uncharacterized protein
MLIMRIGFNFTLGPTLGLVQRLVAERKIDYCELLIDNFLQVPPAQLLEAFDCPIGFHIMFSKFMENDLDTLDAMATRLREYVDCLQPLYVSDHVARFTHEGRQLYHLAEPEYRRDYEAIRSRVLWWQDRLGQKLYLENYPSIMDNGLDAPWFFEQIVRDTGAGVLFDASNAVCSHRNCGLALSAWEAVVKSTRHFHVGGYNASILDPEITLDTHDQALASDVLSFLTHYQDDFDKPGATLTYERDDNLDYDAIVQDLDALRKVFAPMGESTDVVLQ